MNALTQQVEKHASEQNTLQTLLKSEQDRKLELSRRVILRIQHTQLAGAFDLYTVRVAQCKEAKAICRRAVLRMQKSDLVNAFDLFSDAVYRHKVHRDMMLELLHTLLNEGSLKAIGMCGRLLQAGPNNMLQCERWNPPILCPGCVCN